MVENNRGNGDITYEIREHIATLNTSKEGWTREVNVVAWNGGQPKIDIRDWSPDHTRMTRGITMTENEGEALARAIAERLVSKQREGSEREDPYER